MTMQMKSNTPSNAMREIIETVGGPGWRSIALMIHLPSIEANAETIFDESLPREPEAYVLLLEGTRETFLASSRALIGAAQMMNHTRPPHDDPQHSNTHLYNLRQNQMLWLGMMLESIAVGIKTDGVSQWRIEEKIRTPVWEPDDTTPAHIRAHNEMLILELKFYEYGTIEEVFREAKDHNPKLRVFQRSKPPKIWDEDEYCEASPMDGITKVQIEVEGYCPDTLDWSQIPSDYNFCVRNHSNLLEFFRKRPESTCYGWFESGGSFCMLQGFIPHFQQGDAPWRFSLLERPNYTENAKEAGNVTVNPDMGNLTIAKFPNEKGQT